MSHGLECGDVASNKTASAKQNTGEELTKIRGGINKKVASKNSGGGNSKRKRGELKQNNGEEHKTNNDGAAVNLSTGRPST